MDSALKAGIAVALLSHLGMAALFALYHLVRGEFVPFGNLVTVPFFGALSILVAGWLTVTESGG